MNMSQQHMACIISFMVVTNTSFELVCSMPCFMYILSEYFFHDPGNFLETLIDMTSRWESSKVSLFLTRYVIYWTHELM